MNNLKRVLHTFLIGLVLLFNIAHTSFGQAPTYINDGNQTIQQNPNAAFVETIDNWATSIIATTPEFNVSFPNLNGSLQFDSNPEIIINGSTGNGDLVFTLKPNTSGFATFNVELKDLNNGLSSGTSTIRLDVEFINAAPTFTVDNPNLVYDEKSGAVIITDWAKNVSPGPNPNENTQKVHFVTEIVSQSNYISFNSFPKVDEFGKLSFEATDKANGTIDLKVYLQDDGENTPPNSNQSDPIDVTITINPINDAPTFTKGANVIIDEHTGPVSIANWATNISAGAPDEDETQQLTYVLTEREREGNLEFVTPPTIDIEGNVSFEATPHYNGYIIYELVLQDDGLDTPSPNQNTSSIEAFTITVNYLNDPPTYDKGEDVTVEEGDVVYSIENWASNISPGISPNEQDQELYFTVNFVQVSGTLAFLLAPQIDAEGTLTFRTTEHTHGEATFDLFLTDDGELVLPHENTSAVKQLILTVTPVNFPPDDIRIDNQIILEKQPIGTEVGEFATSDRDPEDTHNYALVEGEGSSGNEFFSIEGNKLLTNASFNWEEAESHSIRVKSSDGEFSIEKSFDITILKLIEGINFANAITPNADGQNDTWVLEDIDAFPDALVNIYDKAGLTVYKSSGGYTAWDGTANGKQLPMGTYYYVIDLRDGSPIYQGTLTIIL